MKSIWKTNKSLSQLNQYKTKGMVQLLDIEIIARGNDWLAAEMLITDKHKQPFGIVHGGATATLSETVASIAGWLCIDNKEFTTVGLELNINHLKAVKTGTLIAKARAIHLGRLTQVWQVDIFNHLFQQVSTSRLTITVIKNI